MLPNALATLYINLKTIDTFRSASQEELFQELDALNDLLSKETVAKIEQSKTIVKLSRTTEVYAGPAGRCSCCGK